MLFLPTLVLGMAGCGSVRVTNTARTATEQLLLTESWDRAVRGIDCGILRGQTAYLDTSRLGATDQGWMAFRLRQTLLRQGVRLLDEKEQSRYVIEAGVAAYGTDDYDWKVGIPQIPVPGMLVGVPVTALPEVSFVRRNRQYGIVKIALFAYDRATGQYVWESPTLMADTSIKCLYLGQMGPFQEGSISSHHGMKLP